MRHSKFEKEVISMIENHIDRGCSKVEVYMVEKSGSGRFAKYTTDKSNKYKVFCEKFGLACTFENDSPRGGQLGKKIVIKLDGRNKLIKSVKKDLAFRKELEVVQKREMKEEMLSFLTTLTAEELHLISMWRETDAIKIKRQSLGFSLRGIRKLIEYK